METRTLLLPTLDLSSSMGESTFPLLHDSPSPLSASVPQHSDPPIPASTFPLDSPKSAISHSDLSPKSGTKSEFNGEESFSCIDTCLSTVAEDLIAKPPKRKEVYGDGEGSLPCIDVLLKTVAVSEDLTVNQERGPVDQERGPVDQPNQAPRRKEEWKSDMDQVLPHAIVVEVVPLRDTPTKTTMKHARWDSKSTTSDSNGKTDPSPSNMRSSITSLLGLQQGATPLPDPYLESDEDQLGEPKHVEKVASSLPLRLDHLVQDTRKPPLTRDSFLQFLKSLYCEENLEFLVDLDDLTRRLHNSSFKAVKARSDQLVEMYLEGASDRSVNISSTLRSVALEKLAVVTTNDEVTKAWDPVVKEVNLLIRMPRYVEAFAAKFAVNLSAPERNTRFREGVFLILVSVLYMFAMFFWVLPVWCRAIAYPVYFFAFSRFVTAKQGV
eukprot:gb/GEZN01004382.1/.p1 GENE.gb/GEZN01004382.1/~~gb/GEZN01004382.1/.p1  ORF type:complete len:446 (+),score=31.77 gb/GEZN01004382.1/:24-1340(+)